MVIDAALAQVIGQPGHPLGRDGGALAVAHAREVPRVLDSVPEIEDLAALREQLRPFPDPLCAIADDHDDGGGAQPAELAPLGPQAREDAVRGAEAGAADPAHDGTLAGRRLDHDDAAQVRQQRFQEIEGERPERDRTKKSDPPRRPAGAVRPGRACGGDA